MTSVTGIHLAFDTCPKAIREGYGTSAVFATTYNFARVPLYMRSVMKFKFMSFFAM